MSSSDRLKAARSNILRPDEYDPNGIAANEPGAKLDALKPPIAQGCIQYFPQALGAIATVSAVGARKYSWNGWRHVEDGLNRYSNAELRHIVAETQELYDPNTKLLHAAHRAWNALAVLELTLQEHSLEAPDAD